MPRRDECGFFTIWVLGLCIMLIFVAGLSLDLWRSFSERRALAAVADSAAIAGASGINEATFRTSGRVELEPGRAMDLARAYLADPETDDRALVGAPQVNADERAVTVSLRGAVDFTLLRVFMANEPFEIHVTAVAEPRPSQ